MTAKVYPLSAHPENVTTIVVGTVLVSLASIAVALRIWSRRLSRSRYGVDDYLVCFAIILVHAIYAIAVLDVKYGMRVEVTEISMESLTVLLKMFVAYQMLYGTAMAAVKLSYLAFFHRIFEVRKHFTMFARGLAIAVVLWWIAIALQVFLICQPFALNYTPTIQGTCGNRHLAYVLIAAFNICTDVGILLLPLPYIGSLQMARKRKLGIAFMFSIGLLITAISGVRLTVLSHLDFDDISKSMGAAVLWTIIEPSVALMYACLPMLRGPINRIVLCMFSSPTENHSAPDHPRTIGSTTRKGRRTSVNDDDIGLTITVDRETFNDTASFDQKSGFTTAAREVHSSLDWSTDIETGPTVTTEITEELK